MGKDKLTMENAMEIIEKLSEELGEKEMKIMNLEKETRMAIKTTNELEIATMLLMENFITKGIDECIEEGIDQYTISCGGGFFKEKKPFRSALCCM